MVKKTRPNTRSRKHLLDEMNHLCARVRELEEAQQTDGSPPVLRTDGDALVSSTDGDASAEPQMPHAEAAPSGDGDRTNDPIAADNLRQSLDDLRRINIEMRRGVEERRQAQVQAYQRAQQAFNRTKQVVEQTLATSRAMKAEVVQRRQTQVELRDALHALAEQEQVLRLALRGGQAGAWSWDLSTNALYWSDEYYRIFGFEPHSIPPSAEAGFSRVHPEDRPAAEAAVGAAMEHGTPIDLTHRVVWPDGSIHWVRGLARVFLNEQGKPARLAGIALDMTEQRHAEESLRAALQAASQSEEKYRRLVETASEGVWVVNAEASTTFVNQRMGEMLGYGPGELLGKKTIELVAAEDKELLLRKLAARRQGQSDSYELRFRRKDGSTLWAHVSAAPLYDRDHRYAGSLGMVTDITERKRAEAERERLLRENQRRAEELEIANRELESFSYSVSHDLRTPLATIDGMAKVLQEDYGARLPPGARRHLDLISAGIREMDQLIQSLLQLSRLTRHSIQRQPVNMTVLVTQALDTLREESSRPDLVLDVRDLPDAEADPVLLKQVWVNLIDNALKFTRRIPNARIEIGCRPGDGRERVYYVRDNGVGFDMEQADRLFEVFKRLHSEEEYEGSGVGLALVQRIIRRHGGRVWAEAEDGKGATFFFTLQA